MEDFILMKKYIQLLIWFGLLSTSFIACQREKIVISELEPEYKIVTHCYLEAKSNNSISCKIFPSSPVFGNTSNDNKPISDAIVEIGNRGNWIPLTFEGVSQDYQAFTPEDFLVDGETYELKISHPDFPTAYSSIKLLPNYITDKILGKINLINTENDSTKELKYDVSWEDDSRGINYYRIIPQVGYINVDSPTDTFYMSPNYGKLILLTEDNKKGNRIEWQDISNFYPFGENGFKAISIKIYILNIDKTYYDYHNIIQKMSSEGSFFEPTFFNGNIRNSFGIFASCNGLSEKTFPLE
jgi:hypothetical protein